MKPAPSKPCLICDRLMAVGFEHGFCEIVTGQISDAVSLFQALKIIIEADGITKRDVIRWFERVLAGKDPIEIIIGAARRARDHGKMLGASDHEDPDRRTPLLMSTPPGDPDIPDFAVFAKAGWQLTFSDEEGWRVRHRRDPSGAVLIHGGPMSIEDAQKRAAAFIYRTAKSF